MNTIIPGLTINPSYMKQSNPTKRNDLKTSQFQNQCYHIKIKGSIQCQPNISQSTIHQTSIEDIQNSSNCSIPKKEKTPTTPERYKYRSRFSQYFEPSNSSCSPIFKKYSSTMVQTEMIQSPNKTSKLSRQDKTLTFSSDSNEDDYDEMIITSSSDSEL